MPTLRQNNEIQDKGEEMNQGIHTISEEAYHADPCAEPSLSSSIAKVLLNQSPRHAWMQHPQLNPDYRPEENSRFDLGSAAHALLLEGNQAKIAIIEAEDWRTKKAKEERDEARANGLLPVLIKYDFALKQMVKVAKEFIETTELKGIFADGQPEQTVIWQEQNIWCRARPDWLTNDNKIILDYKTTDSAAPEVFIRQIPRMGYDLQSEFYTRGIYRLFNLMPVFIFLAQEIDPPYACSLVSLSNAYRDIADAKVERAMELWGQCLSTGNWPSYNPAIHYAEPNSWQLAEYEELVNINDIK